MQVRAYELYEQRGKGHGFALRDWLEAEAEILARVFNPLRECSRPTNEARQKNFGLTSREREIVSAVVAGYSNKEIAEYFKISEDSVRDHLSNLFR